LLLLLEELLLLKLLLLKLLLLQLLLQELLAHPFLLGLLLSLLLSQLLLLHKEFLLAQKLSLRRLLLKLLLIGVERSELRLDRELRLEASRIRSGVDKKIRLGRSGGFSATRRRQYYSKERVRCTHSSNSAFAFVSSRFFLRANSSSSLALRAASSSRCSFLSIS